MRVLHVGCLPFPTYQGTQAAIASMLSASSAAGFDAELLAYAASAYELGATPYRVHRIGDFPKVRSLRSGPSWGKVALDARCVFRIRKLWAKTRPGALIAHHIEAAAAAIAARVGPVHYVAHTSLEEELPQYFPTIPRDGVRRAGGILETAVRRGAATVAAVSPALAARLGDSCSYLPVPWSRAEYEAQSQSEARRSLGLEARSPVMLYAGNLDRYQGWEALIAALVALKRSHPDATLLLATESDPSPVREAARRAGIERSLRVCRLDGEGSRRRVHAAADVAWIPRRTPGGLPIKMLDAFARGLPVVTVPRAVGGLPVEGACVLVNDDDSAALADGAHRILAEAAFAEFTRQNAYAYLRDHHDTERFANGISRLIGCVPMPSTPDALPARAARARQAQRTA